MPSKVRREPGEEKGHGGEGGKREKKGRGGGGEEKERLVAWRNLSFSSSRRNRENQN